MRMPFLFYKKYKRLLALLKNYNMHMVPPICPFNFQSKATASATNIEIERKKK